MQIGTVSSIFKKNVIIIKYLNKNKAMIIILTVMPSTGDIHQISTLKDVNATNHRVSTNQKLNEIPVCGY